MTAKEKERRRRRLKRRMQRCLAICILFALEVGGAAVAGGITFGTLARVAYAERGYYAVGGEMMAAFAVTVITYFIIHGLIFRWLQQPEKGGSRDGRRNRESTCREVRGRNNPRLRVAGGARQRTAKAGVDYIA